MKKVIFFVVCLFSFTFSSKAVTLTTDYQSNFYSNRFIDNVNYSGLLAYPRIDGKIVYCLNPKIIIGKEYILNNSILNEYTKDQLEYLKLIAKFGYNEKNNTIEYYAATQQLIWEYLDDSQSHFYWSTEYNSNGKIILINNELKYIRDEINNFYDGISFSEDQFFGYIGDIIHIQDFNYQLSNYEVESAGLNEAWIEDNDLYVKINVIETQEIKLKYKTNNIETKTYSSEGYQNLISFGDNIEKKTGLYVRGIDNPVIETPPVEEEPPIIEETPDEETDKPDESDESDKPDESDESDEPVIDQEDPSFDEKEPSIEEETPDEESEKLDEPSIDEDLSNDELEEPSTDDEYKEIDIPEEKINIENEEQSTEIVKKEPVNEMEQTIEKEEKTDPYIKELPNTYNYELKYYICISIIFLFGIGACYKYL